MKNRLCVCDYVMLSCFVGLNVRAVEVCRACSDSNIEPNFFVRSGLCTRMNRRMSEYE